MAVLCSIVTALALAGGFYFGFKVGRENELPNLRKEKEIKKQEEKEDKQARKLERALGNLDRYDGTDKGQEEIE